MNSNINVVLYQSSANSLLVEGELRKLDFKVGIERIESLKELINILNSKNISLIISDYNYNEVNVFEIFNLLKISHHSVPIIVFAEKAEEDDIVTSIRIGARDFITKKNIKRLRETVNREIRTNIYTDGSSETEFSIDNFSYSIQREIEERKRIENALRESEEHLKLALKEVPIILLHQDKDLRYTWAYNVERTYSQNEIIGFTEEEVFSADDARKLRALKEEVMRTGETSRHEIRVSHPGGDAWYDLTIEPLFDNDGGIAGVACAAMDITDRIFADQSVKKSEKFYRELVESSNSVILLYNQQGYITFMNYYGCKLFGYTREEIISRHISILIPEKDSEGKNIRDIFDAMLVELDKYPHNENENIKSNGEIITIAWANKIIYDDNGEIISMMSIGNDITELKHEVEEHKLTEVRLLESEERYRALFEQAPNGIFLSTTDGKFLEVNTYYAQMAGYNSPEELINTINNIGEELYVDPEDREKIINKIKKHKGIVKAESYYKKKDGSIINVKITIKSIPGDKSDNIRLIGYVEDITESKKAEKNSQLLAAIIESSDDAIYSVDLKNNIVTWNKAAETLFGFTKEEALNSNIDIILPKGYEKQLYDAFKRIKSGETIDHYDTKRLTKSGKILDLSVRVSPVLDRNNKINGFSMIARNREEQIKADATRTLLASIVESSDDAIISATLDKDILSWNSGAEKIYGYTEEEVKGKNIRIVAPPDRYDEIENIKMAIRRGERITNLETKRITKSGDIIDVSLTISPLLNHSGDVTGISIISRDITRRKKFEEALRDSEQRLRATFDNAALGIVEVDENDRFVAVNSRACSILGYKHEELLGRSLHDITYHEDSAISEKLNSELHKGMFDLFDYEKRYIKKDGTPLWVHVSVSSIRDKDGKFVRAIGTIEDISERKKTEVAIKEANERFDNVLNMLPDPFFILDKEWRYVYINNSACRQLNKTREELLGNVVWEVLPSMKTTERYRKILKAGEERKPVKFTDYSHIINKWFDYLIFPWNDGITLLMIDVTEKMQASEALVRKEALISDILGSIKDVFYALDSNKRFTFVNDKALEVWGKKREELIGNVFSDVFPKVVGTETYDYLLYTFESRKSVSYEIFSPIIHAWIDVNIYPASDGGVTVYFRNISERKKNEMALRQSESFIRDVLDSIQDMFYAVDSKWRFTYVNHKALELWDKTEEELIGKVVWDVFPMTKNNESGRKVRKSMKTREVTRFETFSIISKVWLEVSAYPSSNGGLSIYFRNINERKEMEQTLLESRIHLQESQERFSKAFYLSPAALIIGRISDGTLIDVNDSFLNMFEYTREEVIGRKSTELSLYSSVSEREQIMKIFFETGRIMNYERETKTKTGKTINILFSLETINLNGKPHSITTMIDITERKRAEAALQDSERKFRALADNISQFAWMTDETGSIFWYNKRWFEYTGTTLDEMKGWGWMQVHHPDYLDNVVKKFSSSLKNGTYWEDIFPLRGKDGNYRWFLSRAVPIYDNKGRIINWFGTNTDITEQREIEQALRRREYVLAQAGMMAHLGAWDIEVSNPEDLNANPLRWSDEVYRIFGYQPGEVESSNELFFAHVHPDDRKMVSDAVSFALVEKVPYMIEHRVIRKDGVERIVLEHGEGVYDNAERLTNIVGAVQDITERKLAEQYLIEAKSEAEARAREAEEGRRILNALMDYIPEGITIADAPDAKIRYVSKQGQKLLGKKHTGLTAEEVADKWTVYHSDGKTLVDESDLPLVRAIQKGEIIRNMEIVQVNSRKKKLILLCNAAPIRDGNKSIIGGIVAWREISDIKKTEEMLRMSEERFRLALHNSPITVYFQDRNLKYIWIYNPQFGYKEKEIIGKTDSDFFLPEDAEKMYKLKKSVIITGVTNRERISLKIDGGVQHFDIMVEPNYNKNYKVDGITCVSVNITEQVVLEEDRKRQEISQLIERSARLASVGVLAGGITHEINQPLNAIRVGAEGILFWNKRNQESLPPMIIDIIHGIASASTRIDEIIKSMRLFWVNTSNEALIPVDINQLIDRVVSLNMQKLTRHHVELKVKYHPYSYKVMAHELQLELVINNIIANAIQAVDKNKKIAKEINITTYIENNNGCIEVQDNGTGLPEVPMDKLFDPFFTTKSPTEGMGLGLAIVKSFLDKFDAEITAKNNDTGGATFRICFKLSRS